LICFSLQKGTSNKVNFLLTAWDFRTHSRCQHNIFTFKTVLHPPSAQEILISEVVFLHPVYSPSIRREERRAGGKPKQDRKVLCKPAAVDTAFLPWRRGLGPAFPQDSAGGREGRRTARGRGCSAASESEGYCPCRTTEVSS